MKECPSNKIVNPASGRCVLKTGKIGKALLAKEKPKKSPIKKSVKKSVKKPRKELKPCKDHQYRDPTTNRCRNKSKKAEKAKKVEKSKKVEKAKKVEKSVKKHVQKQSGKCADIVCPTSKICNPASGRCVLKTGKIGKLLATGSPIPVKPVGIPEKFQGIADDCSMNKEWPQKDFIASGASGKVYVTCKANDCKYVLKSQKADESFRNEVQALIELKGIKGIPKLHAAWTCRETGYLVLEKFVSCFYPELVSYDRAGQQIRSTLKDMRKKGWLFIDTHEGNVMCRKDGTLFLVDFGWAVKRGPAGDEELYPNHPMSKSIKVPVPWYYMEATQNANVEEQFFANEEDLDKAMDAFQEAAEKFKKSLH